MLKKILTEKECASCRNCCVFYEKSRWETPVVSKENAEKIRKFLQNADSVLYDGENKTYSLATVRRNLEIKAGVEEYKCVALDENSGCMLDAEEKPFDCSLWPLRVMEKDNRIFIMLAMGCKSFDDTFVDEVNKILLEGLKEHILDEIKNNPFIVKPYTKNYIQICEITDECRNML